VVVAEVVVVDEDSSVPRIVNPGEMFELLPIRARKYESLVTRSEGRV